jgi:Flp pilus assembly protein TadG
LTGPILNYFKSDGRAKQRLRAFVDDLQGAAAVEFALLMPVLFMTLFGIIMVGLTFNNYIELTEGVRVGARALAIGRSTTTPYSSTMSAISSSAPSLTAGSISSTVTINGTACNSDSACSVAMASAQGKPVSLTASYPCDLTILGVNYAPGCTLSSTTTEMLE